MSVSFLENLSQPVTASPGIKTLPRALRTKLLDYRGVMKTLRAAEAAKKSLGAEIKAALDNQPGIGTCGDLVATLTHVNAVAAQLKLKDGRTLPLEGATIVLADGRKTRINWGEIVSVFGGRSGYLDLSITDMSAN